MLLNHSSDPVVFDQLQSQWHVLLEKSSCQSFCLSPEFFKSWWASHPGQLLSLLTVENNGELVGIAPLMISTEQSSKKLSFIANHELSDYCDFLINPKYATEVISLLWGGICELNWTHCELISMPENSPFRQFLTSSETKLNSTPNTDLLIKQHQQNVCPIISLPSTWEQYLSQVGRKQRHEIKRKWKNLETTSNCKFQVLSESIEPKDTADFIRLHKLSSEQKNEFWSDQNTAFFNTLLSQKNTYSTTILSFLTIDDERVAATLGFSSNTTYYLYNSGINPNFYPLSVGTILTAFTIKSAIESGLKFYDFLRGTEEYKYRFGAIDRPIFDLKISR